MRTGYLGADPELRDTPQGGAVTTFRVASSRAWQSADGASHEETESTYRTPKGGGLRLNPNESGWTRLAG